jgi:protein phosphatase PTC7
MLRLSRFFSLYFEAGVSSMVGPGKKKGEDAYYTSNDVLAVADGVGGWTLSGIDPSKYAWELMRNVENEEKLAKERNAFQILSNAAKQCKETGSSTCVLMVLNQSSGLADTINVGDSGFLLFRKIDEKLEIVNKSKEVLHGFNFPFQLGTEGDDVSTGDKKSFQLQKEDLIILYSDGFSDNLYEDHIKSLVEKAVLEGLDLKGMSNSLANSAYELCQDSKYLSPFAKTASHYYVQKYLGGKPDDITVVVAKVCEKV